MAGEKKIFAVMAASNPEVLASRIGSEFPDAHLSVGDGQWLLVGLSTMTTLELSEKLGLTGENPLSNGIVTSVNSYFGRAPLSVWEWLTAKMGANSGASGS